MNNTKFFSRVKTMLKVDFRRLFTTNLIYIMLGISLVMPILILVMTTMMDGTVSVNPQTGVETVIEGFKNTWQIIGSKSSDGMSMSMDLTSMCNINMLYFIIAVVICIFISDDFRSGYSKNLFTVRSKKSDYVISKSIIGFVSGALMIISFFIGSILGGAIAGLPFSLGDVSVTNLVMCVLSKIFLVGVFTSIYVLMSVVGKQRLWLSLIASLGVSMLLYTMAPMITPLDASIVNVILCIVGTISLNIGLGLLSNLILKKTNLV